METFSNLSKVMQQGKSRTGIWICVRQWQPTPAFIPRESHGQRSLVGYSPWGRKESDMTEWLTHSLTLESAVKNLPTICRRHRSPRFNPWVRKILWRRKWQPTPVFLPGKSHGQWNLAGYSPKGCKESNMTDHMYAYTHTHTHTHTHTQSASRFVFSAMVDPWTMRQ